MAESRKLIDCGKNKVSIEIQFNGVAIKHVGKSKQTDDLSNSEK